MDTDSFKSFSSEESSQSSRLSSMSITIYPADRISNLSSNLMENILLRLPQKDAMRTSILSSKWRYKWLMLPQIVFDYQPSDKLGNSEMTQLIFAVYRALLNHQGPLVKFSFSVPEFNNSSDMNHWLHFLSKSNVQDFTLRIWRGGHYKLPVHLYCFKQLRHLNLYNCVFKPPSTFKGFDMLVILKFQKVLFVAERFWIFISHCPLLEQLTLDDCPHFYCLRIGAPNLKFLSFRGSFDSITLKNTPRLEVVLIALTDMQERAKYFNDRKSSNLSETLCSLPAIMSLSADLNFFQVNRLHDIYFLLFCLPSLLSFLQATLFRMCFKFLAIGCTMETRPPKTLDHLRNLHLSDVCFNKIAELSCALCLIRSSPNLEKLTIRVNYEATANLALPMAAYLELQDSSNCSLNWLREVKMELVTGKEGELTFMKFLLAKATALEKMEILPAADKESRSRGFLILKDLVRFRRASPNAEIIYLDPEL